MNAIIETAETIAFQQSPDAAARYLADYRREACEKLHDDPSQFANVLQIVTAQIRFLNQAEAYDKSSGIAEWFIHLLEHMQEDAPQIEWKRLKQTLRESFSAFFRHYARTLAQLERFEEMRGAMRNALDLTAMLPMAIVFMLHTYLPLATLETIEDKPSSAWLSERCAECLAQLDFNGLGQTPFRAALDNYQFAHRDPSQAKALYEQVETLAQSAPDDLALETLKNIFKKQFIGN